jgi:hypothetical protein
VAVILVHYGFLFAIGVVLLGLSSRVLFPLALIWVVASPVVSHLLRLDGQPGAQVPSLFDLSDPLLFLTDIFLTGYYPVLTWISYLLVGLGLGRLGLGAPATAMKLLVTGLGLAVGARLISAWLLASDAARAAIGELPVQFFGTAPTDSWWYLAVAIPHSGTTFDLAHTAGSAMAVIGICLLLARAARPAVVWLAGAGGMTLTLYTVHVLALASRWGLEDRLRLFWIHATAALLIGATWRTAVGRGPLETATAYVADTARQAVLSVPQGRDRRVQ